MERDVSATGGNLSSEDEVSTSVSRWAKQTNENLPCEGERPPVRYSGARLMGPEVLWNLVGSERPDEAESVRRRMPDEAAVPSQSVDSPVLSPDSAYETLKTQYCPVESDELVTPNEVMTKATNRYETAPEVRTTMCVCSFLTAHQHKKAI